MADRPEIRADLKRRLMIECGYRCAIPLCGAVAPLQIDHIVPWATVREHEFENMIVLCANCHGRKGDRHGQIDRTALRQIKANLSVIHHRYSDLERRVLEFFAERRAEYGPVLTSNPDVEDDWLRGLATPLHGTMRIMMVYLVKDGYVEVVPPGTRLWNPAAEDWIEVKSAPPGIVPDIEHYRLTKAGLDFLDAWLGAQPLSTVAD